MCGGEEERIYNIQHGIFNDEGARARVSNVESWT